MSHRRLLSSAALALCVAGCAPDDESSRIVTDLPRDGYALFEVKPGGAKRVAFVVEMRDVDEGTFVLLYTPKEPTSSGWFELDAGAYYPCRHYGPDSSDEVDAGCIVPGGHGALVDAVVAGSGSSQVILRHELGDDEPDASCGCTKSAPSGWYAVMRIAKNGPAIPIAVEAIAMDETEPFVAPTVTDRD
jgi:hypothetical protein